MVDSSAPHLIPSKLVGERFPRNAFGDIKIALIGYCPPPAVLLKYSPTPTVDQYFIHVSPDSVKKLAFLGRQFLSLAHVYGGPVSASTVEELAYYDFDYILAYGLAGGLGTKNLRMGDFYLVESAFAGDGTTPHYTKESIVSADLGLIQKLPELWNDLTPVRAFTGDAIYREDAQLLQFAREQGCDIVNLDSSHLFAAARINSDNKQMKAIACGVISDVASGGDEWQSSLSAMLSTEAPDEASPLARTGSIVEFYIERLAPLLK